MTCTRPPRASERGSFLLLMAVALVVIIGFVGLALDAAHIKTSAQDLQSAADAAALASARLVRDDASPFTSTRDAAVAIAGANEVGIDAVLLDSNTGNGAAGDVVVGTWDTSTQVFTPTTSSPNAVKIVARRTTGSQGGPLGLLFGGLFGESTGEVARDAIAYSSADSNPYVLVLHPSQQPALSMNGNSTLDCSGGRVMVNSCAHCAIELKGNPLITASKTATNGTACYPSGTIIGAVEELVPVEADPLAGLLPDTAAWTALKGGMSKPLGNNGKISGTGTYAPGYYPKGLDIASTTTVTLNPGSYMFGTTAKMKGSSQLLGDGVTIFLDQSVTLDISGGAGIDISPPTSGSFEGLTYMTHRATTSSNAIKLGGNGVIDIEGTIYVPGGRVNLNGTGAVQQIGQIISYLLDISGTSDITAEKIVPPAAAGPVYLVD